VRLRIGDTVNVAGYDFRFWGVREVPGPNYLAARADIEVSSEGRTLETLRPEKRVYTASGNALTETGIDTGLFRDLYVSLGEPLGDGAWSVRIQYKPLVGWIWGGAILMAIGGGVAISDRRYRAAIREPGSGVGDPGSGVRIGAIRSRVQGRPQTRIPAPDFGSRIPDPDRHWRGYRSNRAG
jgi:cytochrome c-type biogenesis protein CcmF